MGDAPPSPPPPLVRLIAVMSHEAVTGLNETVACGTKESAMTTAACVILQQQTTYFLPQQQVRKISEHNE